MIGRADITGVVLAGGRGSRMDGADKGLQDFRGQPLALHALQRLAPQVGAVMVSANRNLPAYASFGVPVWTDGLAGYAGPLAGFLTGLQHCRTPFLATVPCDAPLFPPDLVARLADALQREQADIAMAAARQDDGRLRAQPVFALVRRELVDSLDRFTREGGRKVADWAGQHRTAVVAFEQAGDDPAAFCNANTLAELQRLGPSH